MGLRPYLVMIEASRMIGWRSTMQGGKQSLTQLRFFENAQMEDGDFGEKTVQRVRVFYPKEWALWEKQKDGQGREAWVPIQNGPLTLGEIPLVTFYANRTGFMTASPPLLDLAMKNVEHWQSSSDQRNILTVARFPILAGAGVEIDPGQANESPLGPNTILTTKDPQGKWYYVEHAGAAIAAGEKDLQRLTEEMALLGLQMLNKRPGNPTATASAIDSAEDHSDLQVVALMLQDAIERMLDYMGRWVGLGDDASGSVLVNQDYGLLQNTQADDAKAVLELKKDGDISRQALLQAPSVRTLLGEDFDPDEDAQILDDEAAKVPGPGDMPSSKFQALVDALGKGQAGGQKTPPGQGQKAA
jgi:hypothetical protein